MNRSQALKEAVQLWGKDAAVQDCGRESSPALRAVAKSKLTKAARTKDESVDARKVRLELHSATYHYRYSVGKVINLGGILGGFFIIGEGDTWEEAFAAAAANKQYSTKQR